MFFELLHSTNANKIVISIWQLYQPYFSQEMSLVVETDLENKFLPLDLPIVGKQVFIDSSQLYIPFLSRKI